jgi:signal transduction histidine kinase
VLRDATVRPLWPHAAVPPVSVSASQAATGSFDAQYIETEGILVSAENTGNRTLLLRLGEGSQAFEAITKNPSPAQNVHGFETGSRLRLRGICVTDPTYTHNQIPFALLLRSVEDVQVVDPPPWWNTPHIAELVVLLLSLSFGLQMIYVSVKRARLRAVVEERERLALEMHDTLAQSFAGLGFQLEALAHEAVPGTPMRTQLESSLDLVRFGHTEARRNIAALRPGKLEQLGLARALEDAARSMVQGGPVAVSLTVRGIAKEIPLRIADPLFRIGQEAIANAVRHGHPARIDIRFVYGRSQLKLTVRDDGAGFVAGGESTGFGIRGMKRRADTIGANLKIRSSPGHGASVAVRAPLPQTRLSSWWLRTMHRSSWRQWFHGRQS